MSDRRVHRLSGQDKVETLARRPMNPEARATFRRIDLGGGGSWPEELESLRESARMEGLEAGRKEALEQLELERRELGKRLGSVLDNLAHPYDDLDPELAGELAFLAVHVGATLFRAALSVRPEQVVQIVLAALEALPSHDRRPVVRLHPEDARLCREVLSRDNKVVARLDADPDIERGGCVVHSSSSRVDARVASRIEAVTTALLEEQLQAGLDPAHSAVEDD